MTFKLSSFCTNDKEFKGVCSRNARLQTTEGCFMIYTAQPLVLDDKRFKSLQDLENGLFLGSLSTVQQNFKIF